MSSKFNRKKDYYAILGVDRYAAPPILWAAFRRLALRHHPDKNNGKAITKPEEFPEAPPTPPPSPGKEDDDTIEVDSGTPSNTSSWYEPQAGAHRSQHGSQGTSSSAENSSTHRSSHRPESGQRPREAKHERTQPPPRSKTRPRSNAQSRPNSQARPTPEPEQPAPERKESTKDRYGAALEFIPVKDTKVASYFDEDLVATPILKDARAAQKQAREAERAVHQAFEKAEKAYTRNGIGNDEQRIRLKVTRDDAKEKWDRARARKLKIDKYVREHTAKARVFKEQIDQLRQADLSKMKAARGRPSISRECKGKGDASMKKNMSDFNEALKEAEKEAKKENKKTYK